VAPPVAVDDFYKGRQGEALVVAVPQGVLVNDSGDSISVDTYDTTTAAGGSVTMNGNGRFTYVPLSSFWCDDTFDYTIRDSQGQTDSATVTITVAPVLANVEQVELGNTCGFAINGEATGDLAALAVSGAGDVDGDGLDDLVVGAPYAGANDSEGRSYVVFGNGGSTPVSLADIASGAGGFVIEGEQDEWSGWRVKRAGDVNNDNLDDLIIGSPFDSTGGIYAGRAYVVFGKDDNTDPVSLATVAAGGAGAGGFVIEPEAAQTLVGQGVSAAGDVNGDGFDDVVVGAQYAPEEDGVYEGRAYVVFGKSDYDGVDLSTVAAGGVGAGGFKIDGVSHNDYAGFSVGAAGDVDGDNLADVIVGAPGDSTVGAGSGRAYVVFGQTATDPVSLADIAAETGSGFAIQGVAADDVAGFSVGGGMDVSGDGVPDLVVGSFGAAANGDASGRAYVVFGKSDQDLVDLADVLAGTGGFAIDGVAEYDNAGYSVAIAGDIDGDGLFDILVGAPRAGPADAGRAYVVYGRAGDTSAVDLADIASGLGGFALDAASADDMLGCSVEAAGDVDNDGFDDVIVGARQADPVPSSSGTAYVVRGGDFR